MKFDDIIKARQSVREFNNQKVKWKDILEAVDTSIQGPFAGNNNNLKFIIVEDEDSIEHAAAYAEQDWIAKAKILIIVCSDETNLENIYGERGRVYSRQQAGAAIQTLILKLTELKIKSCWVGAYSDDFLRDRFEIPKNIQIEAIIAAGKSGTEQRKKRKKSLENVLYWERWGKDKRPTLFEESEVDL